MHILFVHQNYPAQFGQIARRLSEAHGCRCSFVSLVPEGHDHGVTRIQYQPKGGATQASHYFARTFENAVAHAHGVFEACRDRLSGKPDLIVGHSGFGSTLLLRELYDAPIINYFEYFYRAHNSDMDFRPEFPVAEMDSLRAYCRNAMILLDLENCDAGYSPTPWQQSRLPVEFRDKVEVIFDGVDTQVWHRHQLTERTFRETVVQPQTRIVTYVSRGFESMRGFDVFMKAAKRIYQAYPEVIFFVVGEDRIAYGGDKKHIRARSFKEHVLSQDQYDLSRFVFTGRVPPTDLARLLSMSDLHIYLTVPFVLSWSLFNAMACGCTILASDTAPVRDVIRPGENGYLADFHDVAALADRSIEVLRDPEAHRHLGSSAMELISSKYRLEDCLARMLRLYERVVGRPVGRAGTDPVVRGPGVRLAAACRT